MSSVSSMEAGSGTAWFSELELDHLFTSLPHEDWDSNSAALGHLHMDLDGAQWSSWDDLIIPDNNGCSVNKLSLPTDLLAIEKYLKYTDVQDDNINIEEDPISSPRSDANVLQIPIDNEHPAEDQLFSGSAHVVTNKGDTSSLNIDHGSLQDMECNGLRLLHLLTACAEAMSQGAQDLVEVILCRLQGLVSPTGSTMERVAYYLYHALLQSNGNSLAHLERNDKSSKEDFLVALKLLHVAYPYIQIPHFTANQSILEAVAAAGSDKNVGIHVIDFDIMEGMQWPPLMEALKSNGNYDVGRLRITAIRWAEQDGECPLYSGHTGRRLSEYASSVGIPFSFQETDLKGLKEVLRSHEGEIVIVNCMWQLPHMFNLRDKSQLLEFLVSARHLNPKAVTLATGPHGAERNRANFWESFCRCLQDLCAIFDSLEAGLPHHGLARAMVERFFFGHAMAKTIVSSSACGPPDNRKSNVVDLPLDCSYSAGSISKENMLYAKYTLQSVGRGSYEVEMVGDHRLVMKWGCAPLVWVSTWKST